MLGAAEKFPITLQLTGLSFWAPSLRILPSINEYESGRVGLIAELDYAAGGIGIG
jgi:hypothetical protein